MIKGWSDFLVLVDMSLYVSVIKINLRFGISLVSLVKFSIGISRIFLFRDIKLLKKMEKLYNWECCRNILGR